MSFGPYNLATHKRHAWSWAWDNDDPREGDTVWPVCGAVLTGQIASDSSLVSPDLINCQRCRRALGLGAWTPALGLDARGGEGS